MKNLKNYRESGKIYETTYNNTRNVQALIKNSTVKHMTNNNVIRSCK